MEELEIKTYDFAVQAIGFAKSIEKEYPEIQIQDFKKSSGAVSIKFIEAMNAKENEDFANGLRECLTNLQKSGEYLRLMQEVENERLEKEKSALVEEYIKIEKELDSIIKKLIY